MGAAAHLGIKLGEYDAVIRSLIPHYGLLVAEAAAVVGAAGRAAPAVVDLGIGSGALAQQILKVRPKARVTGIDEDAGMLRLATARLRGRVETVQDNFERAAIPRCDVISASFALHHIRTGARKAALYKKCFTALRPGGLLVSADCCLASSKELQSTHRAAWLSHLQQRYTRARSEAYLRAWAKEDVYFTLEREMELITDAGFGAEVVFRKDGFAVIAGVR
jgi:SAM-dependent methyltransferase